jgi:elongation factor 1 alpha-like protein
LRTLSFTKNDVTWIPTSGLAGSNLMTRFEDKRLTSWYDGPCLVEALDVLRLPNRTFAKPLRITVTDIYQKSSSSLIGDCILGKIEAGVLKNQKELVLMPHGETISIKGIMKDDEELDFALAG